MKIGIDVSQLAFQNTGVANYLQNLVEQLIKVDKDNKYVLFFSSMRRNLKSQISNLKYSNKNITIKQFKLPPIVLDLLWNRLHIVPIEWFIGDVDVFISSDWTQPPTRRAKKVTILYDLIVYRYPEDLDKKIVNTQRRRLRWVKKEIDKVLCISEATKKDVMKILGISRDKLEVVYPGM